MYSDKVMDHFEHPRNVGEIENASGVGTVGTVAGGRRAGKNGDPVRLPQARPDVWKRGGDAGGAVSCGASRSRAALKKQFLKNSFAKGE